MKYHLCVSLLILLIVISSGCIGSDDTSPVVPSTYQPVVNNTNLAPTIDPNSPGTGERVADGTIYFANDSARQVYWFIMNNETGSGSIDVDLFINGFRIQDDDIIMSAKTAGNRSKWLDIPFGANYSANITGTNVHHYEWREYKYRFIKVPQS